MSHEFYQIMVGAPTMSLYSWKQLARWSLEYSCLNDDEKSKGQEYLDASWKKFCSWVVTEFKDLMQDDGITIDNDKAAAAYEQTDQENKNQGMGRPTNNSSA
jgi:adenosine deaminase CECR1